MTTTTITPTIAGCPPWCSQGAPDRIHDEFGHDNDGVTRRMIWRVAGETPSEARISDALRVAVGAHRIIPTLYDELKKRAIAIEKIAG